MRSGGDGSSPAVSSRRTEVPSRLTPILYFAIAHAALLLCLGGIALDPAQASGFYYQPRTIALVHLVTLGWISSSILGSLYVIGPMAMRAPMPQSPADAVVALVFAIGLSGMASHFWINAYGGVGWAAILALAALLHVGMKAARWVQPAPVQSAVKLCLALANVNILLAGGFGIALAFDKAHPFLPARELGNVFAHAHLAAIGWIGMVVMGTGLRMLPMILPSAMPKGRTMVWAAAISEAGVIGLTISLLFGSRATGWFAALVVAGFGIFLTHAVWMLRHRRPPPAGLPRPDLGVWHAGQALIYLLVSMAAGLILSFASESELTYRLAPVYGALGLLGFFGQLVIGVEARILPMFAAYHANRNACGTGPVLLPHDMTSRPLQWATFLLWTAGVPLLALGLSRQSEAAVRVGALLLLAATVAMALNAFGILRHAFPRRLGAEAMPSSFDNHSLRESK